MTSSAAASPTTRRFGPGLARRHGALSGLGWHYLGAQQLPRQAHEILVEDHVREALIRLSPKIAAQPDRADDVLYRLRAILMGVRTDGLVKANEEFAAWLAGERSMPFGAAGGEPRSSHATSRSRRRTALSSGSSPATPRRAWSGTSRVPASRC